MLTRCFAIRVVNVFVNLFPVSAIKKNIDVFIKAVVINLIK